MYLELNSGAQVHAAYIGDRIVGVVMADIKNEPKKYASFWRTLYVKVINAFMAIAFHGKANPDGELCFMAADSTVLGKGIGTQLLAALSEHEKGKLIYLYTDDKCTYQFYEHRGFERSEEKKIIVQFHKKIVPLTCFYIAKSCNPYSLN